jgi:hypothetical protein
MVSTYLVIISRTVVSEVSPLVRWLWSIMGLELALVAAGILNVFITLGLYEAYKRGVDGGMLTWMLSFWRVYVVIGNFLLFFRLPSLPWGFYDDLIIILLSLVIFARARPMSYLRLI